MRQRVLLGLAIAAALSAVGAGAWRWRANNLEPSPDPAAVGSSRAVVHDTTRRSERRGGLDVTFFAASDTHLGFDSSEHDLLGKLHDPLTRPRGVELVNQRQIRDMNAMPGRPWPAELGGNIERPRGVLISGDLTENGDPWQWRHFVAHYGLNGGDGLLAFPVFEGHGNHDKHHSWYVLDRIRERHGATRYAFDWDDLHLVCLGEAPDDDALAWLAQDLASVGRERPVIVYFHFPLQGPYSEDNWFGRGNYRDTFATAVTGYNVIAVFHGHFHASGRYRWRALDVYNMGAAKHRRFAFGVVRVTDDRLRVASWHHGDQHWEWWHEKPINGSAVTPRAGGERADQGAMFD